MSKRVQKDIWEKEHIQNLSIPSIGYMEPSSSVIKFVDYLKKQNLINSQMNVVDIGCGKGRNAIYLAHEGLQVYAIDYIEHAISYSKVQAKEHNVIDRIHFSVTDIDKQWPFQNDFFDLAIDCFSSIDIETENGRKIYKSEMLRTLKPNGYALICVVSNQDEWERELIKNNPGPEKNSSIWPDSGKFQKNYDEQEFKTFYKEFELVEFQKDCKKALKLNKEFNATNFWAILKKPGL